MPSALDMSMAYLEQWNWLSERSCPQGERQRANHLHKLTMELARGPDVGERDESLLRPVAGRR